MKKVMIGNLLLIFILAFASVVYGGKPADEGGYFFGNGFPSGPHYNLNVIFKKSVFTCPDQEYLCPDGQQVNDCSLCSDSVTGPCTPIYGGGIFAPQQLDGAPFSILMESGKKGPRGNPDATSLEVSDWCTQPFDEDAATFRLPANEEGYAVYARITGDPKQNPSFSFTNPRFHHVMDESGNELWLLGFVTTDTAYGPEGQVLSRYDSETKGRKVRNATEITPFFLWTGSVCYLNAADYCSGGDCTTEEYCCLNVDEDPYYENCAFLSNVGVDTDSDGNLECPTTPQNWCCVDTDSHLPGYDYCELASPGGCSEDYVLVNGGAQEDYVEAWCRTYSDWWIFNIADFVGFLFDVGSDQQNTGSVVLKLRFYPLPLNTK